ncbi:hypothetical protein AYK61_07895 [Rhodococcus sp. SBT000017]|nr:hypothetical protein AYK61_07895 [Rhodococcus sp. SBT000017]
MSFLLKNPPPRETMGSAPAFRLLVRCCGTQAARVGRQGRGWIQQSVVVDVSADHSLADSIEGASAPCVGFDVGSLALAHARCPARSRGSLGKGGVGEHSAGDSSGVDCVTECAD